jgi:hypothetical protein
LKQWSNLKLAVNWKVFVLHSIGIVRISIGGALTIGFSSEIFNQSTTRFFPLKLVREWLHLSGSTPLPGKHKILLQVLFPLLIQYIIFTTVKETIRGLNFKEHPLKYI